MKVGDTVRITQDSKYSKAGWAGTLLDFQTKAVATVRWTAAPHAGSHQTVLVKRLAVAETPSGDPDV